jgi:hypothetical protein
MSPAKIASKKRKRDASPEAHFSLSNSAPGKIGPLVGA